MKKNNTIWLLVLSLSSIFAACKKDKNVTPPTEQLPAATQSVANTFGCLINGNVFIPKGYRNPYPNYRLFVDPTFQNGSFQIRVYNFNNSKSIDLNLNSNNINAVGNYLISNTGSVYIDYSNENTNCSFSQSLNSYLKGYLNITRYDLTNMIFSGTFEFELKELNSNCDTIKVTQGRFDKKL